MKILVFGNPLVPKDSIALQVLPQLRKRFPSIEFAEFDAVEDLEKEGPEVIILDAVEGIQKCELITDLGRFEAASRSVSMHDFDLYKTLMLLHKMGVIQKATVIGIPTDYKKEKAVKEAELLIKDLLQSEKEFLYWVDAKDKVLGKIEREEAHEKKLLHRSGIVLVFNSEKKLFVTKRSSKKKLFPCCFDCGCSFHVRYGETYDEAARRELAGETGIKKRLEYLGKFVVDEEPEHLIVAVHAVQYDKGIILDPKEAQNGKFCSPKEVGKILQTEKVTNWFMGAWKLYKEMEKWAPQPQPFRRPFARPPKRLLIS